MFIIDDLINAWGASQAADAQERQAREAMGLQRDVFNQQQANYREQQGNQQPWLDAGRNTLAQLLGQMQVGAFDRPLNANSLANDPGFMFRMQEGQKALERSAAARGGLNSGGFMKSLARYSQGLASDEFQNAWSRNQAENAGRFNRLASLAGVGQQAANTLAGMNTQNSAGMGQYANSMSDLYGAIGNARAAGQIGMANGMAGGVRSAGNLGLLAFGGPQTIPAQSTGLAAGYLPRQGFGLNYGGG